MYDIVCGIKLDKRKALKGIHNKKNYGFCSKDCRAEFKKNSKKFLEETPVIEFQDVHKEFHLEEIVIKVLRGLSLKIWKGDFIAIMGASGSGKSTAMNIIGALDTISQGKVLIDGQDVSTMDSNQLAKIRGNKIGFVFQTFNLLGALNCEENISLPLFFKRNGDRNEQGAKNVQKFMKTVGLGERAAHKPLQMSGGEQQRTAIARALVNDPELILADEPTGNLDSETGATVLEILKNLNEQGRTLVVITHDAAIAKMARRILHMKDGVLIQNNSTNA